MITLRTTAIAMSRIVIGYIAACLAASLGMFIVWVILSIGGPSIEGRSAMGDFANQAGYIPVFAAFVAVFAAPVALFAIVVSEIGKIDKLWFFIIAGALAAVPALFTGNDRSLSEMLEGFSRLGPAGALAGATFWLIRHHNWPV